MSIHINRNLPDKTPLPGTFCAALCDPPWSLQQKGDLGAANHYDLMTDERILGMGEAMQEIMAENSFCFLWVTTATVPLGIKVLEAWGYRYTSFYFWAKPRFMLDNTFRNSGELLLLGIRGKGTKVAFKGQPNWGMHALQAHSRKPEESTSSSNDSSAETGHSSSCSLVVPHRRASTGTSGETSATPRSRSRNGDTPYLRTTNPTTPRQRRRRLRNEGRETCRTIPGRARSRRSSGGPACCCSAA